MFSFLDHMTPTAKDKANELLAKAIYVSGAPLSMVEHPLWQEFFKLIRPAYSLPTRKSVSTTLLDAEFAKTQNRIKGIIADARNLALQCDGWSNLRNESILNFIINTPQPVFVDSINTKDNCHTGEYIAGEMKTILMKYDPRKFLVVIGDNASNMKKAGELVENEFPHIVSIGCIAHTLHLLCNDIVKCESVSNCFKRVVDIIKTIKQSHILTSVLSEINETKGNKTTLHLPVVTRWGSFLHCLDSMMNNRVSLQTLAVSEKVGNAISKDIKTNILDDDVFWIRIEKLANLLRPVVSWISRLESDKLNIHNTHGALAEIEDALKVSLPESPLSKSDEKIVLMKMETRKEFALKPIHLAACMLHPSSQGHTLKPDEQFQPIWNTLKKV
ncbi:uncharacterized protein LOC134528077 [Bacillus rossius redtenbacheri]|uniref:uncharacterized protein LOC134528077 n=1 Tax=Bacillus rossius redtenbacheri TaxID=93214 RepID=UPI002FDD1675